jgi:hypothetical protein
MSNKHKFSNEIVFTSGYRLFKDNRHISEREQFITKETPLILDLIELLDKKTRAYHITQHEIKKSEYKIKILYKHNSKIARKIKNLKILKKELIIQLELQDNNYELFKIKYEIDKLEYELLKLDHIVEYNQYQITKLQKSKIPKNSRKISRISNKIIFLRQSIFNELQRIIAIHPLLQNKSKIFFDSLDPLQFEIYIANMISEYNKYCKIEEKFIIRKTLHKFTIIMRFLLYDLNSGKKFRIKPKMHSNKSALKFFKRKNNFEIFQSLMIGIIPSHPKTFIDLNHNSIGVIKPSKIDNLKFKNILWKNKEFHQNSVNKVIADIYIHIHKNQNDLYDEIRRYSKGNPSIITKLIAPNNSKRPIYLENIGSRLNRIIVARASHICNSNFDRQLVLRLILEILKNYYNSTEERLIEISRRFIFQKTIPSVFLKEIKKSFADYFFIKNKSDFLNYKLRLKKSSKSFQSLDSREMIDMYGSIDPSDILLKNVIWDNIKQKWIRNRIQFEIKSIKKKKREDRFFKLNNLDIKILERKVEDIWNKWGKYDTVKVNYIPHYHLDNIIRQARNICFRIITLGVDKVELDINRKNIKRLRHQPLKERFSFIGLDKDLLSLIFQFGDVPSRQRIRLIKEIEDIQSSEEDLDIKNLYESIYQKWNLFLSRDDTCIDYLNYFIPSFNSGSISLETSDTSNFRINTSSSSQPDYDMIKLLNLENKMEWIKWSDKGRPTQFISRRFSILPLNHSDIVLNNENNSVVRPFSPKKPQLIIKNKNKMIVNVPYLEGKVSVPYLEYFGIHSGNDLGIRTKNTNVILRAVYDTENKKIKELKIISMNYINSFPPPYNSYKYSTPINIFNTKHGTLNSLNYLDRLLSDNEIHLLDNLIKSNSTEELSLAINRLNWDELLFDSKIFFSKIKDSDTIYNDMEYQKNITKMAKSINNHSRYGKLLSFLSNTHKKNYWFLKNLLEISSYHFTDKESQSISMKAENILNIIFYKLAANYVANYNLSHILSLSENLPIRGFNIKDKEYKYAKKFLKSMKNKVRPSFNKLGQKSNRSESSSRIYNKIYRKNNTSNEGIQSKYWLEFKRAKKIIGRRSINIANATAAISQMISQHNSASIDAYEELSFISNSESGSGVSTRGFLFSEIQARIRVLSQLNGIEFKTVKAAFTSKEYYGDYLSQKKEISKAEPGYFIPHNKGMKFLFVPHGNITLSIEDTKKRYINRDGGASICIGGRSYIK